MIERRLRLSGPLHLRATLGMLRLGPRDPTMRLSGDELVRSSRTPDGPATLAVRVLAGGDVEAGAWGPGADHVLAALPALLGEEDDTDGFDPSHHPTMVRAVHRLPGLRIGRSGDVEDVLVPTILGQRVTGQEAGRAWARLVHQHAEPAPGPQGLLVRPPAAWFAGQPDHVYAGIGVERTRATTIREACRRVARLQEAAAMTTADAEARLRAVPGLGPWTASLVQRLAFGDPDPVEVGDFHVPNHVCWQLAGEARGTDERMLDLLSPWAGHRGRAVSLLVRTTQGAPRRGPRGRIVNSRTVTRRR